jgi:Cu/Ag efflux pump CusA
LYRFRLLADCHEVLHPIALALLPLALAAGSPSDEIEGPMAIVILGGLIPATLVSLLVLSAAAARWLGFRPQTSEF